MVAMNYLLQSLSQSVENIFGLPDDFEEIDQLLEEDYQSEASSDESSLSDDDLQPNHHFVTPKDLEEGHLPLIAESVRADEVNSNTKGCDKFLLSMACGFVASLCAFINGTIFVMNCPEYWVLPSLLMLTGACGIITLPYLILKVLGINFDRLRRYKLMISNTTLAILLLQEFIHVAIFLYFKVVMVFYHGILSTEYGVNCMTKFYYVTYILNIIAVLMFLFDYVNSKDYTKSKLE